jgi:hypothetical protein
LLIACGEDIFAGDTCCCCGVFAKGVFARFLVPDAAGVVGKDSGFGDCSGAGFNWRTIDSRSVAELDLSKLWLKLALSFAAATELCCAGPACVFDPEPGTSFLCSFFVGCRSSWTS